MKCDLLHTKPEQDGWRRCAVALHSIAASDREWVLSKLPAPQSSHVRELLSELESLGIPRDRRMVRDALASMPAGMPRVKSADHAVTDATAKELAEALAAEPVTLVAHVLASESREKQEAVLQSFPFSRSEEIRVRIRQASREASAPRALKDAVAAELQLRLKGCAPTFGRRVVAALRSSLSPFGVVLK